jgi:hypothetical protein
MAALVPTVAAVMLKSFDRPKIVEALEQFTLVWRPRRPEEMRQGAQGAAAPAHH